jgi:hypothetical protein
MRVLPRGGGTAREAGGRDPCVEERGGERERMLVYDESGTTPEPVACICQLVRASREAATGLRLHVQQQRTSCGAGAPAAQRVLRRDEVQRREHAVRRPAERLALRRLSISTFVCLAHNEQQKKTANSKSVFGSARETGTERSRGEEGEAARTRQRWM